VITHSIEINRRPEDVFAYLDSPERHGEWQRQIVSIKVETQGPIGVGTRVRQIRKVGRRELDASYEVTKHDPPRTSSFRGVAGPVRPEGTWTVEPIGDGSKARVSVQLQLVGHGIGKLIVLFARPQARKALPENQNLLKARLEGGA
jgi:hypothetical protein